MQSETILSVGIDIGTSTTSLVVSHLQIENTASFFQVPRVEITSKKIAYLSKVHATPQISGELLDVEALKKIIEEEYCRAGITPAMVDTGAVIITGESSRKENAKLVTQVLSGMAGAFVIATAGPDLESVLAAKGAGAQDLSSQQHCTVVNFDIGGGTTNIAVFRCGKLVSTGCLDIGGRLIRLESWSGISYISPRVAMLAQQLGIPLVIGARPTVAELSRLTDRMAELLAEEVGLLPKTPLCDAIRTETSTLLDSSRLGSIDFVTFSGGVAKNYYDPPTDLFQYNDIGPLLAQSIHKQAAFSKVHIAHARQTIHATVIGAGSYSTTVSGSTIDYSDAGLLPMQNLPTLVLSEEEEAAVFLADATALEEKLRWVKQESDAKSIMLCLTHSENPSYQGICRLAKAIICAYCKELPQAPILVSTQADFAKVLGQAIRRNAPSSVSGVIVIDGVSITQGDYIDLGCPIAGGVAIPVVVKTLVFG